MPGHWLSRRARLLLALERFFPVIDTAPAVVGDESGFEFAKAAGSYQPFVDELGGLAGKTVLDFGCGWGGETAWLAQRSARAVGCDINADALDDARRFTAQLGLPNASFAACTDRSLPFDDQRFDAVFSTNVFEHVMRPADMLREIRRVLKPGGSFITRFGPLFYSPLGYHLCWATQVPYAHLLFGFKPIIEVRNTKREPWHPADWRDTGLNTITFAAFRRAVVDAGLEPWRLQRVPVRGLSVFAALACSV